MTLQIIVTIFIAAIVLKLLRQKQLNHMPLADFLVWLALWLAVLVVFWQPDSATYLANVFGIGRGADLIVYLSIIIIFYLVFRIFIRINKIDADITKIVRQDALKNDKTDKNHHHNS